MYVTLKKHKSNQSEHDIKQNKTETNKKQQKAHHPFKPYCRCMSTTSTTLYMYTEDILLQLLSFTSCKLLFELQTKYSSPPPPKNCITIA